MKKVLIYTIIILIVLTGLIATIKPVRAFVVDQVPEELLMLLHEDILKKLQSGELRPPENPPGYENAEGGINFDLPTENLIQEAPQNPLIS